MQKKSKTNKNINNQKKILPDYTSICWLDNYFFNNPLYDIENNKSDNNNNEHIFKLLLNK